jgi:hypothetical protein
LRYRNEHLVGHSSSNIRIKGAGRPVEPSKKSPVGVH